MVNSSAEQGCINSKLLITSGCKTPIIPDTLPFITISAQRPDRKRESERSNICQFLKMSFISYFYKPFEALM